MLNKRWWAVRLIACVAALALLVVRATVVRAVGRRVRQTSFFYSPSPSHELIHPPGRRSARTLPDVQRKADCGGGPLVLMCPVVPRRGVAYYNRNQMQTIPRRYEA